MANHGQVQLSGEKFYFAKCQGFYWGDKKVLVY
jgi:hypothetical protein